MVNISLVATDLDGTLLDGEGRIPVDFPKWVKAHPEICTVIASGRQVFTLQEQFADIANELIFIADNGAVVMERDELLYENSMDPYAVSQIMDLANELSDVVVVVCGLNSAYIAKKSREVARRNIEQYYARRAYLDNPADAIELDKIIKIALFFEHGAATEAGKLLGRLPQGIKSVVSSACWIDIANENVNKGEAIINVQTRLGIDSAACAAFGDYLNDIELLEACGESYAMANAVEEVRAVARHSAPANTEDGVMSVLRAL